jgi:hypothetical protein
MLLEYNAVICMMVTVLPISKFGIVSSYVIKYALPIAGIESNPGSQLNNKKNIKIIHNNVCSLLLKLDLIEHEFQEYDVICISESHLDKSIDNDEIKLKSFQNPVRLDRNRHGGGVTIYVKNSLYYKVRTDLLVNNLEILWVEIRNSNNDKFLVGVITSSCLSSKVCGFKYYIFQI